MTTNDTLKGMLCGAIGGAVGTYVMSWYMKGASAVAGHDPISLTNDGEPHGLDEISVVGDQTHEGEGSTDAVGRILHEKVTGQEPPPERKTILSQGVHWGYGIGVSAIYGAMRGRRSMPDLAGGATFGTVLWALGDEMMVPMLGLSKGPTSYPLEQHAHRFGAHVVYGLAAAATTQALLGVMAPAPTRRQMAWNAIKAYATLKTAKSAATAIGAGMGLRRRRRGITGMLSRAGKTAQQTSRQFTRTAAKTGSQIGRTIPKSMGPVRALGISDNPISRLTQNAGKQMTRVIGNSV